MPLAKHIVLLKVTQKLQLVQMQWPASLVKLVRRIPLHQYI